MTRPMEGGGYGQIDLWQNKFVSLNNGRKNGYPCVTYFGS
jgi:hypothetical protein